MGSSPRMRGTPPFYWTIVVSTGIIPAYAGNTMSAVSCIRWAWDHPRVCGEHNSARFFDISNLGSSPRMRGTPIASVLALSHLGIIPAYAGNTRGLPKKRILFRDHPRVCGEHLPDTLTTSKPEGSSPRMRGTQRMVNDGRIGQGDHPRVCGEHRSVY